MLSGKPSKTVSEALPDIASLDARGLARLVSDAGEPAYRADQLTAWLYRRLASSFDAMTDLPASMRQRLSSEWTLRLPEAVDVQRSQDGTRKYLWRLSDDTLVESVGIPSADRLTVCFSTQAGCAMGCRFCATGRGGFARDLFVGEMAWQVALVGRDFGVRVSNAVAMGQGEPFNNYDATLSALRLMNSPHGLGIGARHLTVSTSGIVPGIDRFAREPEQFTLAVSLHSAVQPTRDWLMPGLRQWPLPALREALQGYAELTGRRPSLEFSLMAGVNDSDAEIQALIEFARGWMCHVNLIPVNPIAGGRFASPPVPRVSAIASALRAAGIECSVRKERGVDIDAACGQLTQKRVLSMG